MKLCELYRDDVEQARKWRNEALAGLRTPYLMPQEMQQDFYEKVVLNRDSPHRYWAVRDNALVGIGGITNIQWENSLAEISLIIRPECRHKGNGTEAASLLLDKAFNYMNIKTVFGEAYLSGWADFWKKVADKYNAYTAILPARKFWDGKYWGAFYFSIDCDEYNRIYSALH